MMHGGNVWRGGEPSDWLDYSANIRPEGAPEWVREALAGGMRNVSYYPDPGMRRAGRALAEYLKIDEACVCPTAGGISAIDLATHLPASGMLVCTPCFGEYAMLSERRGKPVCAATLLEDRHRIGAPAAMIGQKLFGGCAVWLCNPLNPVGIAFSVEQIRALLDCVERADGWLIVDEAFIDYCPEHSVVSLVREHERLLVTGSMTKILGIPGVRLGYLCAQPQVLGMLKRYQLTWELSCFAEAVACALPEHAAEIQLDAQANARRREMLRGGLEQMGVFVYPSEAAFLLADFGRAVSPIARELEKRKILVRECANFDGLNDGCHLRLAVKDERSNRKFIEALREAMTCAESR